jgi:hypothetical protein
MIDWILLIIAVIACFMLIMYLDHKKKMSLIERGLWKPDEGTGRAEDRLITGLFFLLLGAALLIGSCFTHGIDGISPDLVWGLRISALVTGFTGIALILAYTLGKRPIEPA